PIRHRYSPYSVLVLAFPPPHFYHHFHTPLSILPHSHSHSHIQWNLHFHSQFPSSSPPHSEKHYSSSSIQPPQSDLKESFHPLLSHQYIPHPLPIPQSLLSSLVVRLLYFFPSSGYCSWDVFHVVSESYAETRMQGLSSL